jgi:hypothetical protein
MAPHVKNIQSFDEGISLTHRKMGVLGNGKWKNPILDVIHWRGF